MEITGKQINVTYLYGWEVVESEITDLTELNRLETYYITELNSMEQGYNSTLGGDNCYKKEKLQV